MSSTPPQHASTSTLPAPTSASVDRKPKRKRVSRACDQCFLKKDRCDGVQPICTFCSQLGRSCTYDRPERKRGPTQGLRPRLEQRIAALETVLGFVLAERGEEAVKVDVLKQASEEQRAKWRKENWWKSNVRKQLEREWKLTEDLVTTASPHTSNAKHKDSDTDYSDVDLSLPPTHQPPDPHPPITTTTHRDDSEISSDDDAAHHFALLSSGVGGSSLNRGLVPRGADPNAALGGFEIEFGGNQTDIDWVRRFVPPNQARRREEEEEQNKDSSAH